MCVLQLAGEEYWRGSFAQSIIAPPGAALGMMVGAGTRLRGSLLGTSTPSSVSLPVLVLRLLFTVPGDLFQGHHGSLSPLFIRIPGDSVLPLG